MGRAAVVFKFAKAIHFIPIHTLTSSRWSNYVHSETLNPRSRATISLIFTSIYKRMIEEILYIRWVRSEGSGLGIRNPLKTEFRLQGWPLLIGAKESKIVHSRSFEYPPYLLAEAASNTKNRGSSSRRRWAQKPLLYLSDKVRMQESRSEAWRYRFTRAPPSLTNAGWLAKRDPSFEAPLI